MTSSGDGHVTTPSFFPGVAADFGLHHTLFVQIPKRRRHFRPPHQIAPSFQRGRFIRASSDPQLRQRSLPLGLSVRLLPNPTANPKIWA
eukprot:3328128-Rhodomonas_salina.1